MTTDTLPFCRFKTMSIPSPITIPVIPDDEPIYSTYLEELSVTSDSSSDDSVVPVTMDWPVLVCNIKACENTPMAGSDVTPPDPTAIVIALAAHVRNDHWVDLSEFMSYYCKYNIDLYTQECIRCHNKGHVKQTCPYRPW